MNLQAAPVRAQPAHPRTGRTVAIVGAGFSGVATAVQLMRRCGPGTSVVLINESGRMARGLAYGTRSSAHVLNVPAGNMSALPEDPDNFLRFCRWNAPELQADAFVPRPLYGDYLESLLSALEVHVEQGPRLQRVVGRVTAVTPATTGQPGRALLQFDDGRSLLADDVVLAFGHFPPRSPLTAADEALAGTAYIADPWRADALAGIGSDDPVVLVGCGLTAVDVVLALQRQGHRGPIVGMSRHGLAPLPHRAPAAPHLRPDPARLCAGLGGSLRAAVAALRTQARVQAGAGLDWRDLMNALRGATPALWAGLSQSDRARFLRHVRPYWETLRHRCAPQAHAEVEALAASGRLERLAARVQSVRRREGMLELVALPRGGGAAISRPARAIVNCTGPATDVCLSSAPLVQQLLARGLLSPDPLRLGLLVDAHYRVLGCDGCAVPWLHYVGPLLKAMHWEATAVPELRVHAARLAEQLCTHAVRGLRSGDPLPVAA